MLNNTIAILRCMSHELSQTALTAAAARAAHLIVDHEPLIFADPLAAPLLGDRGAEFIGYHRAHGTHLVLSAARGQVICRSRYAEDALADRVRQGLTQYIILGAGLDSFAYRSPFARQVQVYEVDRPATQRWKRAALDAARIGVPGTVTFVPVDFEADSLAGALASGGLDLSRPALVSWLGVTMYLTRQAVGQALAELAGLAPGSEIIADYMLPAPLRDSDGSTYAELVMPSAAAGGEPWRTFLRPEEMSALLAEHGFGATAHIRQRDQVSPELWERSDSLHPIELSVVAHAVRGHPV
jgi:methyltransferase (TIGR00027 family)